MIWLPDATERRWGQDIRSATKSHLCVLHFGTAVREGFRWSEIGVRFFFFFQGSRLGQRKHHSKCPF